MDKEVYVTSKGEEIRKALLTMVETEGTICEMAEAQYEVIVRLSSRIKAVSILTIVEAIAIIILLLR